MKQKKYLNGFKLTLHEDVLNDPLAWKKPHTIFVCSMSDLFHEDVPFSFIDRIMDTVRITPQHRYQLLTKRAERMAEYFASHIIPKNVWLGVTVESKSVVHRIDALRTVPASVRFLSCEPLIESLGSIDLSNIQWVIVGGESGHKARPMREEWVLQIQAQAERQGTSFFFKQWGTWGSDGIKRNKHANGKTINGKVYQSMPA
jgi:protein gp37